MRHLKKKKDLSLFATKLIEEITDAANYKRYNLQKKITKSAKPKQLVSQPKDFEIPNIGDIK